MFNSSWLSSGRGGLRASHSSVDFYTYQISASRRPSYTNMYEAYNRRHVYSDLLLNYSYMADHDRFNYRRPDINYDQPPRKALRRPRRPTSELSLDEQPVMSSTDKDETSQKSSATKLLLSLFGRVRLRSVNLKPETLPTVTEMVERGGSLALRHSSSHYEYTALEDESNQQERFELERKARRTAAREKAYASCEAYLRDSTRYVLLEQLNDIGSRLDKNWFVVRDTSIKTERLLALVPRNQNSPISCTEENREILQELFVALQHPYIYPVLDLDFREFAGSTYVLSILPLNSKGSLKDLIYRSRWQDDWGLKYGQRSTGLPISQVQRLGRQILEALLFLRDRGFPPCAHLHSGNIVLQNGVARLTGLENTLLGYTSRIHPVIWGRARSDPSSIDAICFGHILFEMCAGYELCTPQPTPGHILDIQDYPQVQQVLEFIFQNPLGRYPSIEDISLCDFFRNIDLRELRAMPLPMFQTRLTPSLLNLLNEVRLHQKEKRPRRSHSTSVSELPPREKGTSLHSNDKRDSGPITSSEQVPCEDSPRACSLSSFASQEEVFVASSSPVPSLYATPHASMSVLLDRFSDSAAGETCSEDGFPADDEQSDYSPAKEHRGLSLHLQQQSTPALASFSLCEAASSIASGLTRRTPSTI